MRLTLDLDPALPETYRLLNFCIYIAQQPNQLVVLSGNQTLQQVNEKFWKVVVHTHIASATFPTNPNGQLTGVSHSFVSLPPLLPQVNKPLEMYYSWKKS